MGRRGAAAVECARDRVARRPARLPARRIRQHGHARDSRAMSAAIAAGHPATVQAGLEILHEGGSAADVAVAASLASCVAETLMTGLLGGGHAIYYEAASGQSENLDFFVSMPGLGAERREVELLELDVPFGAELIHYAVGIASCGVPGVAAGLEALWQRHGRLEWKRLFEPALRLARAGAELTPAHASCLQMLAPVMTMNEGARIYSPEGTLLPAGSRVEQPGLVRALELVAEEGAASAYIGSIATALLGLMEERGGLVTAQDLETYEVEWSEPVEVAYLGTRFLTRGGLSGLPAALPRIPRLAGLRGRHPGLQLAIGAAGGTRLRSALIEVAAGVLDEGLPAGEAVARGRLHAAGGRVQLEPGFSEATIAALAEDGFEVRVWPAQHHFFGGVSLVTPNDAAGDPRRSGAAARVP